MLVRKEEWYGYILNLVSRQNPCLLVFVWYSCSYDSRFTIERLGLAISLEDYDCLH